MSIFNKFYVSYKIPQISKEFDLLQFREKSIVNIELKRESTEEIILEQLIKNRYYLSFLGKEVFNFSFIENTKKLYILNNKNKLEEVNFSFLIKLLYSEKVIDIDNIDKLFDPTNYLVSPFNTTDKFIESKYFLTNHQEEFKEKILKELDDNKKAIFLAITGSAGTGKTLLTYDIAKTLIGNGKTVLVIHCGYLNEGQNKLMSKHNWEITPIKNYSKYELEKYDLIIIDEAQRIYPYQLEDIIDKITNSKGKCLFSYDKVQTLASWEDKRNIVEKINKILTKPEFRLTEKIRTNKDIASFIKRLFDRKRNDIIISNKNAIEVTYFEHSDLAKEYMKVLSEENWKIIRFTPSLFNTENHKKYALAGTETSHEIIGQEFDNVVVVIDNYFSYNKEGKLQYYSKSYYHPKKMLFQNLTRARKKLHLIIIRNEEVLNRCLDIIK